jgi:hypothetical protein
MMIARLLRHFNRMASPTVIVLIAEKVNGWNQQIYNRILAQVKQIVLEEGR